MTPSNQSKGSMHVQSTSVIKHANVPKLATHYQAKRQKKSRKYDVAGIGLHGDDAIASIEGNRD
jgi:hypothetical protein